MGTCCGIGYLLYLECGHQRWVTRKAGGEKVAATSCKECPIEVKPMKVGFTGTQRGMTDEQKMWLNIAFQKIRGEWEFHHGDCIGADADAHDIAVEWGAKIVLHPPWVAAKRAFKETFWQKRPQMNYLDRNKEIVKETQVLIGMPGEDEEQLRSGTWSTIRYARKTLKPVRIVGPKGNRLDLSL